MRTAAAILGAILMGLRASAPPIFPGPDDHIIVRPQPTEVDPGIRFVPIILDLPGVYWTDFHRGGEYGRA